MFRKNLDTGEAGDNIEPLRGVERTDIERDKSLNQDQLLSH